jgi:DNA (cytosine-5)-methyltransferase 1
LFAPRVAEFFAGIGLVRLALERQGLSVVFANDLDPNKLAIYAANFGDEHFALADVHKLLTQEVPDADVFTASFPCNDLSLAGGRAGLAGPESSAFWGFERVLRAKSEAGSAPRAVVLENVPGLLTSHRGQDLRAILQALAALGYVFDLVQIDAVRFVPQSRARLFVLAERADSKGECAGAGEFAPSWARPTGVAKFIQAHPELPWRSSNLPAPSARTVELTDLLDDLPDDHPAWWNAERTGYFFGQIGDRHGAIVREWMRSPTPRYATAFRRVRHGRSTAELRFDGVAGCLRTPRGGSARQILVRLGDGRGCVRLLSARECARLQGVADDFRLPGSETQALFGFGDAVCVPVVSWLAEHWLLPSLDAAGEASA